MAIFRSVISCRAIKKLLVEKEPICHVFCQKVHIKPQKAKPPSKDFPVGYYDVINMERGRPMSPFISIYKAQIQGVSSIHHRVTGTVCIVQLACFALAVLLLPESIDFYVDKIKSWNLPSVVIFLGKVLNAWPWCAHTIDGARRIALDLTCYYTKNTVMAGSWLSFFLAAIVTIYISLP